jgi:hypothetical protein
MIVGNGVRLTGNPGRSMGAPLANTTVRSNWNKRGALMNLFTDPSASKRDGIPSGMRHPQVWLLPVRAGALASRSYIVGDGGVGANLAGGRNGTAGITGLGSISTADAVLLGFLTGTLTGQADGSISASAVGSALAGIVGSGALNSNITSVLNAIATLAGVGTIDAAAVSTLAAIAALIGSGQLTAGMAGSVSADAAINGTGLTAATIDAITRATAALSGAGELSPPTLAALGLMLADPQGLGSLGGSAVAKGSMGALISLAASMELSPDSVAASVKAALLDAELDGYTIEEIIKLTSAVLLGKSSGGATAPVFRSLNDLADRVTGEVDISGNRINSVLSP